jgi:hypothetical protein
MAESRQWLDEFVDLRIECLNSKKKKKTIFENKNNFWKNPVRIRSSSGFGEYVCGREKRRGTHNQALSLVVVQQRKTNGYSIGFFCPIGWFA